MEWRIEPVEQSRYPPGDPRLRTAQSQLQRETRRWNANPPATPHDVGMARGSEVRHDTVTVPAGLSPVEVRAVAERKAQSQVTGGDMVAFVHLHGSRPVPGSSGSEVEWRYSYHVIPSEGTPDNTNN